MIMVNIAISSKINTNCTLSIVVDNYDISVIGIKILLSLSVSN